MSYRNFSTAQLQEMDAAHHLHPFTDHKELREAGTRIISRAEGAFIYDTEGHELLDAMAGLWCVNIGYGRKEMADAAAAQMMELPFYNNFFKCTTPAPTLLAKKLAELAPAHINQVMFGSSGSESNDTALRLVRHYWALLGKPEKNKIISRDWAYHGSTVAGASLGGMSAMHEQLNGAVPNIEHVMQPYTFELSEKDESDEAFGLRAAKAVEDAILKAGAENVAAFIAEPIQGAGGVRIPPASYWPEIQRICKKYDVLIMLDEVVTGYGRTGAWFAAQSMQIEADTMTTAKALTSGYQPLSALLISDRIAKVLEEKGDEFFHGYTYAGHPVACAVALKNIEIIESEGMIEQVRDETGPYLAAALKKHIAGHSIVGEVRTFGFIGAIEIVADKQTNVRFDCDAGTILRDHMLNHGLMMRSVEDTMIMSPPLMWTTDTIDLMIERTLAALDDAEKELRAKK